ncbi:hypothetical protein PR048_013875 [Dryococelus australis]|uniref:Uncharacterized protein n=1 Tax=Dryococelus australis TaxID=614101 RepID=A0ABQ9HTC9_9NEOP|nr:hypothetical protein PR048_013875 [Dryococelus australis]
MLGCFGIAPYLQNEIVEQLNVLKKNYVLLFDERLIEMIQKKQLDIHIRSWYGKEDHVLREHIGSCGLHVEYNAFKTGCSATAICVLKLANTSVQKLVRFKDVKNQCNITDVDLDNLAEKEVKTLIESNVAQGDILEARVSCRRLLVSLAEKLLQKPPIRYSIICELDIEDLAQCSSFLYEFVPQNQSMFVDFDPNSSRIDVFFLNIIMSDCKQYIKICGELLNFF